MVEQSMALQLLKHPRIQNKKRYVYYSIAEGFRADGKSKKRVLAHLGKLTDEQAETIRHALRVKGDAAYQLLHPRQIACQKSVRFLDVSVFHQIFRRLHLSKVLAPGKGDVELSKLLEILVVNRCCEPKSKARGDPLVPEHFLGSAAYRPSRGDLGDTPVPCSASDRKTSRSQSKNIFFRGYKSNFLPRTRLSIFMI